MAELVPGMAHASPAPAMPPQLYALVDLARAPQLLPLIDWLGRAGTAQCLFEGSVAEPLRRVSPHIVALARAPQLLERWLTDGRGESWGTFMETARPMHLARQHVRRFLQMKLPDGAGPVLVRFWDPRVLNVILEHADSVQSAALYKDGVAYVVERDADTLERFSNSKPQVALSWSRFSAIAQLPN